MDNCSKYTKKNIGKTYSFTISKIIELPSDIQKHYVIVDKNNCKFTIPFKNYGHYNFKVGAKINIKLDHINCSGRIFFEPEHPYYKENESYTFEYIRKKEIINYLGILEEIIVVKDKLGKEQWIRFAFGLAIQQKIFAWVEKIKKGKLYLLPITEKHEILQPGKSYNFKIIDTISTDRFGESYVLIDEWNNKHILEKKNYKSYNLESKDWFKARIKKFSSKGFFYIEPEHPSYELNKSYQFQIIDCIANEKTNTYFIEDNLNNVCSFKTNEKLEKQDFVKCRVIDFKKGGLILEFISKI
ncbi:MAG: hypothetical protein JEZ09_15795 [Salinivirgaceae bacterium]|nr:hypothetical protein [Salinivirgaceae bacterium]